MKRILSLFALYSLSALSTEVIISPVDYLYVPQGFDNNDNIEVVVTGSFPNSCYSRNKIDVIIKNEKIDVTVTALNNEVPTSELCEPMTVPFKEEITIGNLQGGDYEIVVNKNSPFEQKGKLSVGVSSSDSVDDHLYALVEYVELGFTGGLSGDAILLAKTPSDCVVFDRVEYLHNGKDTISILPILKRVSGECNRRITRMEIPIKFDLQNMPNANVLLFVRSMEGKSVNNLITR